MLSHILVHIFYTYSRMVVSGSRRQRRRSRWCRKAEEAEKPVGDTSSKNRARLLPPGRIPRLRVATFSPCRDGGQQTWLVNTANHPHRQPPIYIGFPLRVTWFLLRVAAKSRSGRVQSSRLTKIEATRSALCARGMRRTHGKVPASASLTTGIRGANDTRQPPPPFF